MGPLFFAAADRGTEIVVADLQFQPLRTLARANILPRPGQLRFTPTLAAALESLQPAVRA